ncbi:unnamed protein product [Closterium sp. Naga37s-1]|nr:unnamed protein product [Closterium sp. Naga37s-1]
MGPDHRKPSQAHPAGPSAAAIGRFPSLLRSPLPTSHPSRASRRIPSLARSHSLLTRRSSESQTENYKPCEQAAVEVQSVPALPVVALLEESASTDAETETVRHPTDAGKADAATVTVAVSNQAEEAKKPAELKNKVYSFLELLAQEDSVALPTVKAVASSAKVAAWLGVETGSEQGGEVGAEASSGWSSLSRSESSCSSHSACLINLSSDSSSCSSSSAHSLCSSPTGLTEEVAGVKRGIGHGVSSIGKGCSLSTAYQFTELLAAEKKSVKSGIGKGLFCSGKDWSMEVKGFGKAEQGQTVSNLLYGFDDEDEEEEDGSSRQGSKISGIGTMCYMNQLYMDEEEEEWEALAASGISIGIGRSMASKAQRAVQGTGGARAGEVSKGGAEQGRWRAGEVESRGGGEQGRWRAGEVESRGGGEQGRWRAGEVQSRGGAEQGRWRAGEVESRGGGEQGRWRAGEVESRGGAEQGRCRSGEVESRGGGEQGRCRAGEVESREVQSRGGAEQGRCRAGEVESRGGGEQGRGSTHGG